MLYLIFNSYKNRKWSQTSSSPLLFVIGWQVDVLRLSSLPQSLPQPLINLWNCSFDMKNSTGFILLHNCQWDQTKREEKGEHFSFVSLFINEKTPSKTTWDDRQMAVMCEKKLRNARQRLTLQKERMKYISANIALNFSFCWTISSFCCSSCSSEKWAHLVSLRPLFPAHSSMFLLKGN